MELVWPGYDALRHRVTVGNDDVVLRHIELSDGQWHQEQARPVAGTDPGHLLQETGADLLVLKPAAILIRQKVDKREQIGVRIFREHRLEDLFRARRGGAP